MATTTLVDSTFAAAYLGARTDNAGAAVTDTTAEEARLLASVFNPGYITPGTSFQVNAQASPNMTVKVGSGVAKSDYYAVAGTVAGQGTYIVRHDVASVNVTITAADASQTRTDEVYLVIQDNVYDTSSRVLPRIGYRAGTVGGANPGPDTAWKAYALLARVTVGAAVTSITSANISDQRIKSSLVPGLSFNPVALTDATTIATDASLGNYFRVTLGGNRTLANPTNAVDGQRLMWEIIQDATGSRTIAFGSKFAFGSTLSSATLSTTANKRDVLGAIYNASTDKFYVAAFAMGY